jgi:hypothetical protein
METTSRSRRSLSFMAGSGEPGDDLVAYPLAEPVDVEALGGVDDDGGGDVDDAGGGDLVGVRDGVWVEALIDGDDEPSDQTGEASSEGAGPGEQGGDVRNGSVEVELEVVDLCDQPAVRLGDDLPVQQVKLGVQNPSGHH